MRDNLGPARMERVSRALAAAGANLESRHPPLQKPQRLSSFSGIRLVVLVVLPPPSGQMENCLFAARC